MACWCEVLSIAIWVAAVTLALLFGGSIGEWFAGTIELPSLRAALGHGLVFFVTLVAVRCSCGCCESWCRAPG